MVVCWEFKMSSARGGMVGRIYMRRVNNYNIEGIRCDSFGRFRVTGTTYGLMTSKNISYLAIVQKLTMVEPMQ